ncbi:unnamed protein product [Brassica oleracea var. botrytis]
MIFLSSSSHSLIHPFLFLSLIKLFSDVKGNKDLLASRTC